MEVFVDFESFSYVDLKEVGVYRYCENASTEPLCYAIAVDDSPVSLCVPDAEGGLAFPLDWPEDATFVAHNIEFERNLLKQKYDLDIPLERWNDTAARAARMSLPRSLEELAEFFGLDVSAKVNANTARKGDSVCRPREPSKHNPDTRWTPATKPEAFKALYERCLLDVELCREVHRRLLPLEPQERKVWLLTLKMNERGVRVDLDSIPPAREILERVAAPLVAEFAALTGGLKHRAYQKVNEFLGMESTDKTARRKELRKEISPLKRRCLEILEALAAASVSKLDAMEHRAHADNRVRGSFLYAGAERTLRWSSGGVQFQNMKRGLGTETGIAFQALHNGGLEALFEGAARPPPEPPLSPTSTIANMLRGFVIGDLLIGDYAQIEARVLAWLADDKEQLELFRNKGDPYCAMAADIYQTPVTKKDKDKRFMGKTAELSCGYSVGGKQFRLALDDTFDVQVTEEFANNVVAAYRRRHPKISDKDEGFWARLEKGFKHTIVYKKPRVRVTRNLYMGYVVIGGKPFAYIELPNGRKMYYADPEISTGKHGPRVTYFGRDRFSKGWGYVSTYGGKVAENVTQAYSREIIAEGMIRLDEAGYDLSMTVHDECVSEGGNPDLFKELMEIVPAHAKGLPIEVDTFRTFRYRK